MRQAQPSQSAAGLLLADLAGKQRESIRWLVRKRLESAGPADAVEYLGHDGLRQLAAGVKDRGRNRLKEMRDARAQSAIGR